MKCSVIHIILLFLLITALAGLSSCINDNSQCPENYNADDGLLIRFQIMTGGGKNTRAADISGDIEGSGAENYLNLDNIAYLIFDSDLKFLQSVIPDAENITSNEDFTIYDVVGKVDHSYFVEDMDGTLDFYILVLANYSPWGVGISGFNEGESIQDIFSRHLTMNADLRNGNFGSSSLLKSPEEDVTTARFPMSGLQHFTIPKSMLLTASQYMPYDLTLATGKYVNLLRALTKIEIIDKINIGNIYNPETDDKGYRISGAVINGFFSKGSLLPSYDQWMNNNVDFPETQQVQSPTIPDNDSYVNPPVLNDDYTIGDATGLNPYDISFAYDAYATYLREDKCRVYSCFLYEYSRQQSIDRGHQPYFIVNVEGPGEVEDEKVTLNYPVRMADYINGQAVNNLEKLLRNHIYRFEISGIQQDLKVNWTVCPMDQASASIEFN